jgi:hypothetical protein
MLVKICGKLRVWFDMESEGFDRLPRLWSMLPANPRLLKIKNCVSVRAGIEISSSFSWETLKDT